jgi:pimeloyl-ACP methyl ester carboxylesterase|tara:strand:- start:16892 stop:17587 length:696 start_codon:yes stop_codon:yes gene_type:complete
MSTYVLIHGSYQGGWIWKPTVENLTEKGHTVYSPTLDGCGERAKFIRPGITITTQAEEISDFLHYQDLKDVVLVGTSTGGLVTCKTAELSRDRIQHIIFVDALAPQPGEKVADIVVRDPSYPVSITELTRGPSKVEMEERLFQDLGPDLKKWAIDRVTMHPIEATDAPGELDGFWSQKWDATVIRCTLSVNPSRDHQYRTAQKLEAQWHELEAGHYPMLSHPKELSQLLER